MATDTGSAVKPLLLRFAIQQTLTRALLNALYQRLSYSRKHQLHKRLCRLFRDSGQTMAPGFWKIVFAGKEIRMPLRAGCAALDWEVALSPLGHEIEVKQTYDILLRKSPRPEVFVDIGANYGTHSVLFLSHGIETLTFEPNPACHPYFEALCALNHLPGNLHRVALGEANGEVTLRFPRSATWLGSTDEASSPAPGDDVVEERVPQKTLDDFLPRLRGRRVLIKIDAEKSEYKILTGAKAVLDTCRPTVIFEAWRDAELRHCLSKLFQMHDYAIEGLPCNQDGSGTPLAESEFQGSRAENFIARPRDRH